jgi:hypothetical protein
MTYNAGGIGGATTYNASPHTTTATPTAASYFTPEQPFLNIFKTGGGWNGTVSSGTRYDLTQKVLQLDPNGYPTSMNGIGAAAGQTFSEIDTLVFALDRRRNFQPRFQEAYFSVQDRAVHDVDGHHL